MAKVSTDDYFLCVGCTYTYVTWLLELKRQAFFYSRLFFAFPAGWKWSSITCSEGLFTELIQKNPLSIHFVYFRPWKRATMVYYVLKIEEVRNLLWNINIQSTNSMLLSWIKIIRKIFLINVKERHKANNNSMKPFWKVKQDTSIHWIIKDVLQ